MKILYHHRTQAEDAQGIHIQEMVHAFRQLGHEVVMVSLVEADSSRPRQPGKWNWLREWAPDWLYELMGIAYNVYGYFEICRRLKEKKIDLIYERYSLNTFCGIWASRRFRVPLVLEVNAPLLFEQSQLGRLAFEGLARLSERWICSHSTRTIVVSKVMMEILKQEGVPAEKMIVMTNGIDTNKFNPMVSGETVKRLHKLDGSIVIGFVGWFRKWHGLEMLLEVVQEIYASKKDVRLLLVGEGPAFSDLYEFAKKHNLLSTVVFTGPVTRQEVPSYIAAMDIAVQPSAPQYACPMKIIEYMGMGKCIVAPDQANIQEVLEDGISGFLFRAGDKESLKSTILSLFDDCSKRDLAGKNALECVSRRGYLWRANAEKTLDLVQDLTKVPILTT